MRVRIRTAETHGAIVGCAFPEDEERRLTVACESMRTAPGRVRHEIHLQPDDGPKQTVYYDIDSPFPVATPEVADAALIVATFPALVRGGHVHVDGDVSRRLIHNLMDCQAIWTRARPDRYRPFGITASNVRDGVAPAPDDEAIMPLSGGVDSMLTLCRHTDPARPLGEATTKVGACLFLPGLSPRLDRRDEFESATAAVRAIAGMRGLPLAVAETNATEVLPHGSDSHGSLLAAAATLFSPRFRTGLIASSAPHIHSKYRYYGSMPGIDPFFSSGAFAIRTDGGEMIRDEKCAALQRYPEMLRHLLVCFDARGLSSNCCRCTKCTRTMLNFLGAGQTIPHAFPKGLDKGRIPKRLGTYHSLAFAEQTLELARALGVRHPALRKLRRHYYIKRVKHALRYGLTWLIPGVDLLARDEMIPRWLVRRKARARFRNVDRARGP